MTGSATCSRPEAGRLLVDCGLFQGPKTLKALNYGAFPFRPADIDTVLLTHAHIDHSGLLPKLVREGFRGRIMATRGTIDLCSYLLPDAGSIQESEVADAQPAQYARAGAPKSRPIYTQADAIASLDAFRPVEYETWFEAMPGVRARYWNAGHLLGSASIEIEFAGEGAAGKPLRVLASGDIGPDAKLLQPDPEAPTGLDYVISESTYGDSDRPPTTPEARRQHLAAEVRAAHAANGPIAHSGLRRRAHPGTDRRSGRPDGARRGADRADFSRFAARHSRDRGVSATCGKPRFRVSTSIGC